MGHEKKSNARQPYKFVAALLLLFMGTATLTAVAQSHGSFSAAGRMITPRYFHTATLLSDGRVLITGGRAGSIALASAEIYDPLTDTFTESGSMNVPRLVHTATLLSDGKVLIVGGWVSSGGGLASAELYDPSSGRFTLTGQMIAGRGWHSAVLLPNGKVLIAGGYGGSGAYPSPAPAELYDPGTGTFTAIGPYAESTSYLTTATLLADGTVLLAGNVPSIYDPVGRVFSPVGRMVSMDHGPATLLANGKVLHAGGFDEFRLETAELYDPASRSFRSTGAMAWHRLWHTTTLMPDGRVLVVGGETDSCGAGGCFFAGSLASSELFDPSTGTFAESGDMSARRSVHTATLLNDGRVLIAGGVAYGGIGLYFGTLASAEIYTPVASVSTPSGDTNPPSVAITSPANGAIVQTSTITVVGTATDSGHGNNGIASVTVNGLSTISGTAGGSGTANWSRSVTLSQGLNTITIVARDNSVYQNATTRTITVSYLPSPLPSINAGGVLNGASFAVSAPVAPGSVASIFGSNLAMSQGAATTLPLPAMLSGTTASFGGFPVPLFSVSAGQMNIQVPWELAGQANASLSVTASTDNNTVASNPLSVNIATFAPGIFQLTAAQGAIVISNTGILAAPSGSIAGVEARPANAGEYVTIYATGLGPVTNQPPTGSAASLSTPSLTQTTPTVLIGGVPAAVSFSGLAPGYVGLYQVDVQIPSGTPRGDAVPFVVSIGGVSSNTVTIAVRSS